MMRRLAAACVAVLLMFQASPAQATVTTSYWLYCAMPYLSTGFGPLTQCTQVSATRTTARVVLYSPITGQFSAQTEWLNVVDAQVKWHTGLATGYAALETPFGPAVWSTQYRNGNSEGRFGTINLITGLFYPSGDWLPAVPAGGGQATIPATGGMAIRVTGAAQSTTNTFLTLQVNLCSGGTDSTVPTCGVEGAVAEARSLIQSRGPALVTLNEACEPDAMNRLFPAMLDEHPDEWQFWTFMPAGNRTSQQAVKCEDGNDQAVRGRYGNSVLGRLFAPLTGGPHFRYAGLIFPDDTTNLKELQDPLKSELRSWVCVDVNHRHWGCAAHLDSKSGLGENTAEERRVAFNQCNYLTKAVIPFIQAAEGYHPTVYASDLNLVYSPGATYNAQECVPANWFRKGDGNLQHTMATNEFGFVTTEKVPLDGSDHDAWLVTLTSPA
jgi:hypothetical protein